MQVLTPGLGSSLVTVRAGLRSHQFVGLLILWSKREQILQSWIAAVDQHPNISSLDNLTYTLARFDHVAC